MSTRFYLLTLGRARVVKETERHRELALATLRPGDVFGETALLDGRAADRDRPVQHGGRGPPVRPRRFPRACWQQYPELRHTLETTSRLRTLHGFLYEFSNFGRLPARALQALVEKLTSIEVPRGDLIIREGDPPGPAVRGRVGQGSRLRREAGRVRNLAFYREGDFFGELSILNDSPRAASAEAVTAVRLLALQPEAVRRAEGAVPGIPDAAGGTPRAVPRRTSRPGPAGCRDASSCRPKRRSTTKSTLGRRAAGRRRAVRRGRRAVPQAAGASDSFRHVQQIDEMDCGAACLGMVCRHFGRDVSLAHIRQLCHTSRDGTSLKAICHAATELGLAARALKVSLRNLPEMPLPAIVHWEGNHWMVLVHVGPRRVRVDDPAVGTRRIPRKEFEAKWSGYAALFDYTDAFQRAPEAQSYAGLAGAVHQQDTAVCCCRRCCSRSWSPCCSCCFPVFTQVVVDTVIVENDAACSRSSSSRWGSRIVFVQLANLAQEYLLSFAAVRIDAAILDFLTRQLLSLPLSTSAAAERATFSGGWTARGRCASSPCSTASAVCWRCSRSPVRSA